MLMMRKWVRNPSQWLRLIALSSLLLGIQPATAQQNMQTLSQQAAAQPGFFNPFRVVLDSNLQFDSNVFRLTPTTIVPMTGQSTLSDRIIVSSATLRFDKSYGLQRIEGNVGVVDNRYNNFNFLDFTALNYGGAWNWNITPKFHGNLTGSHNEALNNFANMTGFINNSTNKNLRIADVVRLDGVYEIDGAWRLIGGISHNRFTNTQQFSADQGQQIQSAEGGIRYVLPSGSSLTYKFRGGLGKFVGRPQPDVANRLDTRFTEMEHDVQLIWPVSGKTSIDARAGHLQRKHDNFSERDFSGFVGNFNLNYAMTGKTRLTASWARTLGSFQTGADSSGIRLTVFQDYASSYLKTDRFSLGPTWQIDDKVALRMRYDYSMIDFLGGVTTIATSLDQRNDKMHSGMVALDWQLHKAFSLSAMLNHDKRNSNLSGYGFHRSAASVTARITF
jgi:exopolysaccharide biosynthesis operon protein EpsL